MFITDWICACVAGLTADGREITEPQVTDMAETYSQSTYVARIWLEHVRGIDPNSMFKALGDVVEVKAERLTDGALKGKLALFVKLSPHQDLIAMVRNGQKVHLSVEIDPNFAGSNKAYLVGMGVTDSPASLGVGIMKFSANERKQHLFSDPVAVNIKEQVNKDDDLKAIRSMLETLMLNGQPDPWKGKDQGNPVNPPHRFVSFTEFEQLKQSHAELKKQFESFEELKRKFEEFMAQPVNPPRPLLGTGQAMFDYERRNKTGFAGL